MDASPNERAPSSRRGSEQGIPVEVKDRPILFSGPMVRAILEERKTQTRRVMKPQPAFSDGGGCWYPGVPISITGRMERCLHYGNEAHFRKGVATDFSPYGQPGDGLWVRETWVYRSKHARYYYRADHMEPHSAPYAHNGWKPSIFMPREACRIKLEVARVRAERLQEISEEDALAEGSAGVAPEDTFDSAIAEYAALWDSLNKKRGFGWEVNPWVWVVEFKRWKGETQ